MPHFTGKVCKEKKEKEKRYPSRQKKDKKRKYQSGLISLNNKENERRRPE